MPFPAADLYPSTSLYPGADADGDGAVLNLADAKIYLNIPAARTADDVELGGFIPPAEARVARHLGRPPVADAPLEVLAVKVVLGEYWRTQRAGRRGGGGNAAAATEADSGPAGTASLKVRLTELLGEPAAAGGGVPAPVGSFPPAECWPDPAQGRTVWLVPSW
ncbi:MAG: hypothetical protein EPO40_03150 [Myxococcaceae bacterium]|nr:MAG: hypothetical protein EPO40_03150 [Myxococcaceae bacterium]